MKRTTSTANADTPGLKPLVERAVRDRERVVIRRKKKPVAAVVPIEDLRWLEDLEDKLDIDAARKSLADPNPPIPWEEVKKRLGL